MSTASDQATPNYFAQLARIDVNKHVEKKGGFSYLSWAWAVDALRKAHPGATWEVKRFPVTLDWGEEERTSYKAITYVPYLKTDCGYFVEVAVTVEDVTLSQIHPVLDSRNRPIAEPDAFHINTSIQRCLVKAIALHGLGLYVYAGEDLPEGVEPPKITEAQANELVELMGQTNTELDKFLHAMKIEKLSELPASRFDYARTKLLQKLKVRGMSKERYEEKYGEMPKTFDEDVPV